MIIRLVSLWAGSSASAERPVVTRRGAGPEETGPCASTRRPGSTPRGCATSAACPLTDVIEDQTRAALDGIVNDFRIEWVWMPPWGPDKITDDGREMLRALGFNIG